MSPERDPIVAVATAPGRGGIGIVRLSGRALTSLARALLGALPSPRRATRAVFRDAAGAALDDGLALWFPAPNSYTGEDVLELHGHGGPVVLQLLLARCLEVGRADGLRLAEPGEFTRRAFLNDRLDLAQAEAVADLIDAASGAAARSAARSLTGEFSRAIEALVAPLTELRALVEATLDFPEEEIDFLEKADAAGRLTGMRAALEALLRRARQGAVLRDGLHVVLVGAPNVGKSSLLNALAGEDVAIVTPVAGTTRDRIESRIEVDGLPLAIVDTAGLRPTDDPVERIGIERTLQAVARADVVLHLVDASAPADDAAVLAQVGEHLPDGVPVLTVRNKIDLTGEPAGAPDASDAQHLALRVSARSGAGLDALRGRLAAFAGWERADDGEHAFLARARHLDALERAQAHLAAAAAHAAQRDAVLDLFAEELRLAQQALGEITGAVSADDLLGVIFSRFCIGK